MMRNFIKLPLFDTYSFNNTMNTILSNHCILFQNIFTYIFIHYVYINKNFVYTIMVKTKYSLHEFT